MGHRLSKIYTRTGDRGSTGLADGSRVSKDDPRVEAMGTIDELNSLLGVLLAQALPSRVREILSPIQHRLFDLGGELALPGYVGVHAEDISDLERQLDELNADLPPLKEFILPAGSAAASHCHLARAVCRRCERVLVTVQGARPLRPEALAFVNRLSDLLFVIARVLARADGGREVLWQPRS